MSTVFMCFLAFIGEQIRGKAYDRLCTLMQDEAGLNVVHKVVVCKCSQTEISRSTFHDWML